MDSPTTRNYESRRAKDLNEDAAQIVFTETQAVLDAANFLKPETNPVARQTDPKSLAYGLEQYPLLPLHIMDMLKLAKKAAARAGWQPVAAELDRNIGQERGSDTQGISHYTILTQAMHDEFGMDARNIIAHPATDEFVRFVKESLRNPNPHYCLGIAYALESSAVPELRRVGFYTKTSW